jgi:hypothetical protein
MTQCPRCHKPGLIDDYGGVKMCFDCYGSLPSSYSHVLCMRMVGQQRARFHRRMSILFAVLGSLLFVAWAVSTVYRVAQ